MVVVDYDVLEEIPVLDEEPETLDAAGELLMKTAEEIEKRGWCRSTREATVFTTQYKPNVANGVHLKSDTVIGSVCFIGALSYVVAGNADAIDYGIADDGYFDETYRLARKAYLRMAEAVGDDPVNWNDCLCESKEEMISALKEAARLKS